MDERNKYFMIDCGTLLTNRKYQKDLDSVIERAKDSGNCVLNGKVFKTQFCHFSIACLSDFLELFF